MKRKIIKQGKDTLTITLPRGWANTYTVKPGDEIELQTRGNTLIVSTDKLLSFEKKKRDISHLTSILPLVLLSLYRKGYDEIELTFEKHQTLVVIQNLISNGLTGYNIIEHGKNSCLIKALSDVDMDFNNILRKLFILVKIKLEKITEAKPKHDDCHLQTIVAMNSMPSKLTDFCYRLISKKNIKQIDNIPHLQAIVSDLENLDSQLNLLINLLLDTSLSLNSKQLFTLIRDFKELYCDFYLCYYNLNLDNLASLINRKNAISEKLNTISSNLNQDENRLFLTLNNSLMYFNNIVNSTLVMNL